MHQTFSNIKIVYAKSFIDSFVDKSFHNSMNVLNAPELYT